MTCNAVFCHSVHNTVSSTPAFLRLAVFYNPSFHTVHGVQIFRFPVLLILISFALPMILLSTFVLVVGQLGLGSFGHYLFD